MSLKELQQLQLLGKIPYWCTMAVAEFGDGTAIFEPVSLEMARDIFDKLRLGEPQKVTLEMVNKWRKAKK